MHKEEKDVTPHPASQEIGLVTSLKVHQLLEQVDMVVQSGDQWWGAGTKVKAKASEESSAGHLSKDQWINGISGFYEMDRNLQSNDQQNKWYTVKITWTEAKGAFKWQNRAGVTWTLTPLSGSSGSWDETKLAVGNDCPYKNEGHEFANIEWVSSEVQYISVLALYSISTV